MIKINLLPYREKAKKDTFMRQVFIAAGAFVLFILALVWVTFWIKSSINDLETQIKDSEATIATLDKKIVDLEKYKKIKSELEQKIGVIATLEENRLYPVKTLDNLAMLVPTKDIWIVRMIQKGNTLSIEGIGRDNIIVANFMKTVEQFEPIKSVDLVASKKTEVSGITLQQFTFACVLKKGF